MMECIFCKIVNRDIREPLVYEGQHVVAFRDINPQAPTHVLIVPRQHIASVADLRPEHAPIVEEMLTAANTIAQEEGVAQSGYRLVLNRGPAAGQSVDHLHMHLLAGRKLAWPPG